MPYIECHHCNKIIHNVSILMESGSTRRRLIHKN